LARSDDQGVHGACRRCSSAAVTGALNTLRPNSNHPKTVKALPDNIIPYSSRWVSRVMHGSLKERREVIYVLKQHAHNQMSVNILQF